MHGNLGLLVRLVVVNLDEVIVQLHQVDALHGAMLEVARRELLRAVET
jgi:hypothetical protein